jgi:2-hydroxychromene-2-carboxylate isomerase
MSRRVEFFFDVGSPASYLAWTQLPGLCQRGRAQLIQRPMLLGAVFQATGNRSPVAVEAKRRYMLADLERHARRYGVAFRHNPHFPINTLALMRGATGVQMRMPERLDDYLGAVFRGLWIDQRNLADPAIVAATLTAAGFDPAQFQGLVADDAVKLALRATTDEAVARGVFGAPTVFVDNQMYFGQDRLSFVAEALGLAGDGGTVGSS